jgi:AraC family transcriptional regulator
MAGLTIRHLLNTESVSVRDVRCLGECRHKSAEEYSLLTYLVFPYRGIFVRHLGQNDAVADANQVLFFNQGEGYRVSHPIAGGDDSLVLAFSESLLRELAPPAHLRGGPALAFRQQRLYADEQTQALAAELRHRLHKCAWDLEGESLALSLTRRLLDRAGAGAVQSSIGKQKLVDRAKLVLSSDLTRRWTLAAVSAEVGVSPVYLTQAFHQVEGVPLYRYNLRLRLTRTLQLIPGCGDLSQLALDLGFSSHSHFSAAFRRVYGRTPREFSSSAHGVLKHR